jgi:hypothetical protein
MAKKKQDKPEDDPIPPETVDQMMLKCGRRCCICRRYRPTRLQVHHIKERSDGGTHDEDNLIVTCQTCHTDVHSHVPFMRRFSEAELKGHRDALIKLVREGTLPATGTEDADVILDLISRILGQKDTPKTELMAEGRAVLITACEEGEHQGRIMLSFDGAGWQFACGNKEMRLPHSDRRRQAAYKKALEQLEECKLIEDTGMKSGQGGNLIGWWTVRYDGYLAADELAAEAKQETGEEGNGQGTDAG